MKFSEVLGQHQVKKQLTGMATSGRISHNLLFTGPKGSGKLPLAMAYAQYLLCENPTETDSCGECSSCKRISNLEHPDLHLVYPVIKKKSTDKPKSDDFIELFRELFKAQPYFSYIDWVVKLNAENKQAGIFVSENEALIHKLSLKSYGGKYKIFIFWMMEKVNMETANKLLKALEEPPENTIFLLISDRTELILPTIISRSQLIRTQILQSDEIAEGLRAQFQMPENEAQKLAVFADGSFNKAISLVANSDELGKNLDRFIEYFRMSYSFNIEKINKIVNDFKTMSRDNIVEFLQYCLFLVRNNMALNMQLEDMVHLTEEERKFSQNFSKMINPNTANLLSREFEEAIFHITRNVNTKIVMFDLAIKIHENLKNGSN
ncbi:DNA polymerase III subunit gamma/tau [Salinivirga cyanobacteriivorans]|uniref:DNA polymerase III subunit gamma/tau n=1 Tax=Salinivirga cyanobacteriivorans TaxID=1307839 RepID=A0A0S2HZV3_9BACT|nr:ATP-binding protein [Salinivirga cyanobacteriivorans]ALO15550.1 DNA polymerase III subunit gamma/tau [Salinivirga cyanobacteriivorans]